MLITAKNNCEMKLRKGEGLLDEDRYLMDTNLEILEETLVKNQEYWFLAVNAAKKAHQIWNNPAGIG